MLNSPTVSKTKNGRGAQAARAGVRVRRAGGAEAFFSGFLPSLSLSFPLKTPCFQGILHAESTYGLLPKLFLRPDRNNRLLRKRELVLAIWNLD